MTTPQPRYPRLRSLELQGYKTFATKTAFEFAPTITAIVGPNGSGKSNIADAIRWVLGEQSFSLLRGKRTEDMIFAGSETRARAGMAAATITFDNRDGWLPIDFTEVSISRRAYRDGTNEYLLNGQKVRLRDIMGLLAKSGLSERTYTIIGQGLVDAALSLKADERRRLFEEAAGIELYRTRREEALRRLDATQRNLERIEDLLTELQPRLRSLARQARRAREAAQVREDLRSLLRVWYGYHWYHVQERLAAARRESHARARQRDSLRAQLSEAHRALAALRAALEEKWAAWKEGAAALSDLRARHEAVQRDLAVAQERLRWLVDQEPGLEAEVRSLQEAVQALARERAGLEAELARAAAPTTPSTDPRSRRQTLRERLDQLDEALTALEARRAEVEARLEAAQEAVNSLLAEQREVEAQVRQAGQEVSRARAALEQAGQELKSRQAGLEAARRKAQEQSAALERAESRLAEARQRLAAAEARCQVLVAEAADDAEADISLFDGTPGFLGWLLDHAEPMPGTEMALRAALGSLARLALLEEPAFWEALSRLGGGQDPVGGFGLATTVGPEPPPLAAPEDPGCLGNAAELLRARPPFDRLARRLLNRTLVVQDLEAARRLLPGLQAGDRLVTLVGQVLTAQGVAELPLAPARARLSTAAEAERERAAQALQEAEAARRAAQGSLEAAQEELASLEKRLATAEAERGAAAGGLEAAEARLGSLRERLARLQARLAEAERALADWQRQHAGLEEERLERRIERDRLEAEWAALVGDGHGEAEDEQDRLQRRFAQQARERLRELARRQRAVEADLAARRARLEAARRERMDLEGRLAQATAEEARLRAQVEAAATDLDRLEREVDSLEAERRRAEVEESGLRASLDQAERAHAQAQIELARLEEEAASLRRRIEDDFGLVAFEPTESTPEQEPLPLEGLVEHLPRVEALPPETESQVRRLRAQLRRLGPVNPEAEQEYQAVQERVEFLSSQLEDLRRAETSLREVIRELDGLMEQAFARTFEAVAREFRQTFTRLFGGGSARLVLTDPDDLTGTGIEIEARLPGRREQTLAMLSGGERSLTASALIFALLKVSPTPFCVLDEVDAMLDEANVLRFCEMLRELSQQTQFIVITHNRQTVQTAEIVYGVSMAPDSTSQVIGLRLDEAEKLVAA